MAHPIAKPAAASTADAGAARDLPVSLSQRRLLDHQRNRPAQAGDAGLAFLVTGAVDAQRWLDALRLATARLEPLRTRFVFEQDWLQRVERAAPLQHERVHLAATGLREAAAQARAEAGRRMGLQLDCDRLPLVRFLEFSWDEDGDGGGQRIFSIYGHHALLDGASILLLMRLILDAYAAGDSAPAAVPDPRHAEHGRRQLLAMGEPAWADAMRYWQAELGAGCPRVEALRRADQAPRTAPLRAALSGTFDADHHGQLAAFGESHRVKPSVYYLAVYCALLHLLGGQAEFVVSAPFANRSPQERDLLGFLANVLPIRCEVEPGLCLPELASRLGTKLEGAYGHAIVPAAELSRRFDAGWHAEGGQLSNVLYNFFPVKGCRWEAGGLRCEPLIEATPPILFYWYDLSLTIIQHDQGCYPALVFFTDVLSTDAARRLLDDFVLLAQAWVRDPALTIGELGARLAPRARGPA